MLLAASLGQAPLPPIERFFAIKRKGDSVASADTLDAWCRTAGVAAADFATEVPFQRWDHSEAARALTCNFFVHVACLFSMWLHFC